MVLDPEPRREAGLRRCRRPGEIFSMPQIAVFPPTRVGRLLYRISIAPAHALANLLPNNKLVFGVGQAIAAGFSRWRKVRAPEGEAPDNIWTA